ncbi:g2154 [Coccomyxa viridis]|uniref:G2154 protein n=1 Tax=Coccomyxa viridis TaxID=1274662 RepID=A0ABP1FLW9_9CHLO
MKYYDEHRNQACLAAAVAALSQTQAPAAEVPLACPMAQQGGEQGEMPVPAIGEPAQEDAAGASRDVGEGKHRGLSRGKLRGPRPLEPANLIIPQGHGTPGQGQHVLALGGE